MEKNVALNLKSKSIFDCHSIQDIYNQSYKPLYIKKELPEDHEYIWEKVQRLRREENPLMAGAKCKDPNWIPKIYNGFFASIKFD